MATAALAQGYVGASVGPSDFKIDGSGLTSCDKKDTAYKLYGGHMFMPYLGVEAGWADLGNKATGPRRRSSASRWQWPATCWR